MKMAQHGFQPMTHICVKGLDLDIVQALNCLARTNVDLLLVGLLGTKFREIHTVVHHQNVFENVVG